GQTGWRRPPSASRRGLARCVGPASPAAYGDGVSELNLAPVDVDGRSIDASTRIGGEQYADGSHLRGRHQPSLRRQQRLQRLLTGAPRPGHDVRDRGLGHRRVDVAGTDTGEGDAAARVLRAQGAHQTEKAMLGGSVRGQVWRSYLAGDRRDRDDRTRAALDHARHGCPGHEERSFEIDRHDTAPGRGIQVSELVRGGDARVVDKDVEPAQLLLGTRHHSRTGLLVGDVERNCDGAPPALAGHSLDLAEGARRHRHPGAFVSECKGDLAADAAAASGDQGGFAVERPHHWKRIGPKGYHPLMVVGPGTGRATWPSVDEVAWTTPEELVREGFRRSRVVMMNEARSGLKRCERTRRIGARIMHMARACGATLLAVEAM